MEWLKDTITPGNITLALTAITWLWHKVRGEKHASVADTVWAVLEGVAIKLAESDNTVAVIRDKLTAAAWEGLSRIGVKKTSATIAIVNKVVERGVSEVRKRVLERKQLEAQIMASLSATEGVGAAFKPPANPTVPPLGLNIEIVKPE